MSILSFDIGINNLSYCILSPQNKIQGWKVLNISCCDKCNHIIKGVQCDKKATHISENTLLCNSHSKLKMYTNIKKYKNKKDTIYNLSKNIINVFDSEPFQNYTIEYVFIENQPCLKNPIMKSIQMIVYSYFLIKLPLLKSVELCNACNKLKCYKGPHVIHPYTNNKNNKYKINKFLAIKYCTYMITNDDCIYIDLFSNSKKKDDLADSYLQGIYCNNKLLKDN